MAEMVEAILNGQFPITIPKHRADRPQWYTKEGWERARLNALHETIKSQVDHLGDCRLYYVGAEEGEMPALCQMWGARVVLFEPNPKVWPNIKAIWDANKLEYPISFCGFASNESSGQLELYAGFPPSADGEVISNHGFMNLSEIDREKSSQIKVDDLIATGVNGLLPPTILTMDVEGSEWEVLRGAEQTLRLHKPVIFLSLHPEFMYQLHGEYASDCRTWIKALGYEEQLLDYQHEVHLAYWPRKNHAA